MSARRLVLSSLTTATLALAGMAVVAPVPGAGAAPARFSGAMRACGAAAPGEVRCHALVTTTSDGRVMASATVDPATGPAGLHPDDIGDAYKLDRTRGADQTIAIVDAHDNPKAEADLAVYRSQFGLPPCTTGNGCFRKVDQRGGTRYPRPRADWALEIALDLDAVSATCPRCKLLLVLADTATFPDIGAATDYASAHADVVNHSYGADEFAHEVSVQTHYSHPGVPQVVSTGDNGFGPQFPASSRFVTAVGGTTLRRAATTRGWNETVWSGAGSGCSKYITKPDFQLDTGCSRRTIADVAAVADPGTGLAVYNTYQGGGWIVVGGTSLAAPIISGVYGLARNGSTINGPGRPYRHPEALFDVVSGSNGFCGGVYLCKAAPGYDGPTGLGTPNGWQAF